MQPDLIFHDNIGAEVDAVTRGEKKTLRPVPPYRPFPVDVLPRAMGQFIGESAAAMGCDPAFIALPALAATAAAIGMTRVVELRGDWTEPAIVWAIVIAPSGTLKSPAHDAAVKPLLSAQSDMLRQYDASRAEYDKAQLRYEADLAAWKKKRNGDPPEAPPVPIARRIVVNDATIEALAPILLDNPRGLLLARDEGSGWLRGFDQYKGGKGGDEARWLELHRGGALIVDRKTGDRRTMFVSRAAVSVCGTIQPGVFASIMAGAHTESGLTARLLLARPPIKPKRWTERGPSQAGSDRYATMLAELLRLDPLEGERGPEPIRLPLSRAARATWAEFYNRHARRTHAAESDREAAALSKLEAYAARFALIFTLADDRYANEVTDDAMRRGVALAEWFAHEAERVYVRLGESEGDRELHRLAGWIAEHGGAASARDVTRALRAYPSMGDAEAALDKLEAAGLGQWEESDRDGGGWPTRRLALANTADAADCRHSPETPKEIEQVSASAMSADETEADASSPALSAGSSPPTVVGVSGGRETRERIDRLRKLADRCQSVRPDLAAKHRAEADRLENLLRTNHANS